MKQKPLHEEMLERGAREAPEPETAEERSRRLGWRSGAGIAAGGGLAALKFGGLFKVLIWIVAFHGAVNAWRMGSWVGLAIALVVVVTLFVRHQWKGS
jgi:hypothetical protein